MFKRRSPRTPVQNLRELFWPSMGWLRAAKYTKHRVLRLADSPKRISLGLALGTAISFTPLVGTHFIQAAALGYIFRANILASLIGTFAGNPWTFPFMWWAAMQFGSFMFNQAGLPADTALPVSINFATLWDLIKNEPLRIVLPWFVGGYLLGILSIPPFYYIFYKLVQSAKSARSAARQPKRSRIASTMAGRAV